MKILSLQELRRGSWHKPAVAGIVLLWVALALPFALGERTLFFRDVFTIHQPWKAFGARELAAGNIPATNPTWGLGQPYRGNPNALPFYPSNVLYLVLPFWSAFNLHYLLHWLLSFFTLRSLAKELGQGPGGALLSGLGYAGSGFLLTCLTFYNLITVAAWWPLALLGAHRGGRRGIALGGLAVGLALLGGEPVTAALGLVPLLLVAVSRAGLLAGLGRCLGVGLLGLAIALPQVVATARVLPGSFRAGHGIPAQEAGGYAFSLVRLLELAVPFPFGHPGDFGPDGFWMGGVSVKVPFVFTLYCGVVGLALAVFAAVAGRRSRRFLVLALAGVFLAWLGGVAPEVFYRLGAGLFRFPEKFLFWPALALPLLAGWGLESLGRDSRVFTRLTLGLAAGSGLLAAGGALFPSTILGWIEAHLVAAAPPGSAQALFASWRWQCLLAAAALAAAAWAARRRWPWALVLLQGLTLLPLSALLVFDATTHYETPPPLTAHLGPGRGVLNPALTHPPWTPMASYLHHPSAQVRNRWLARDLDAAPGVLHGLEYPLAPDVEGLSYSLYTLLTRQLPHLDGSARRNWLRVTGVDAVLMGGGSQPGLVPLAEEQRPGPGGRVGSVGLYRVPDPAPEVLWPEEVITAANPGEALRQVSLAADPLRQVSAPRPVDHHPGGSARLRLDRPDRIEIDVESQGGLLVIRRAYQPLWRARSRRRPLPTLPADLVLLGVVVPPGKHRVVLTVSPWPEVVAGGAGALALLGAAAVGLGAGLPRRFRPGGTRG